jgi:hypothetical protein
MLAERRRGEPEVVARRGLRAVDPAAELDHVEIELQYPPLGEMPFQRPRQQGLLDLPQRIARGRQPEVLGELLRDGRGAAGHASPRQRIP